MLFSPPSYPHALFDTLSVFMLFSVSFLRFPMQADENGRLSDENAALRESLVMSERLQQERSDEIARLSQLLQRERDESEARVARDEKRCRDLEQQLARMDELHRELVEKQVARTSSHVQTSQRDAQAAWDRWGDVVRETQRRMDEDWKRRSAELARQTELQRQADEINRQHHDKLIRELAAVRTEASRVESTLRTELEHSQQEVDRLRRALETEREQCRQLRAAVESARDERAEVAEDLVRMCQQERARVDEWRQRANELQVQLDSERKQFADKLVALPQMFNDELADVRRQTELISQDVAQLTARKAEPLPNAELMELKF